MALPPVEPPKKRKLEETKEVKPVTVDLDAYMLKQKLFDYVANEIELLKQPEAYVMGRWPTLPDWYRYTRREGWLEYNRLAIALADANIESYDAEDVRKTQSDLNEAYGIMKRNIEKAAAYEKFRKYKR